MSETIEKQSPTVAISVVLGAVILALHTFAITLYNAPPNPLSVAYREALVRYVQPYFTQQWSLFAPDPLDEDVVVLARFRTARDSQTAWYDLSSSFLDSVRHNPLTSVALFRESLMHGEVALIDGQRNQHAALPNAHLASIARQSTELQLLYRTAMATNPSGLAGPGLSVQLAVGRHAFPRFNARDQPTNAKGWHFAYLPWTAFVSVARVNVFHGS